MDRTARDLCGEVAPEDVENMVREGQLDENVIIAGSGELRRYPRGVVTWDDVVVAALG